MLVFKNECENKTTKIFLFLFIIIWFFLFWKCKFGIANIDESFYLTIPYRLCQGDSLLLHEWHLSQCSAFLLYPFMKIYLSIFGNTTGILLNFRYLFTIMWGCATLFFYFRLKKISNIGAIFASVSFFLYTPFGIMALSYNSMGILFLLMTCIIVLTDESYCKTQHIIAGFCFGCAVLCCPYLLIPYATFAIHVFITNDSNSERKRLWMFFSVGTVLLLVIFISFILHRALITELYKVIPFVLHDPEHPFIGISKSIKQYLLSILYCNSVFPYTIPAIILLFYVGCVKGVKKLGFEGICIIVLIIQFGFIEKPYINYFMFPVSILGLYCAMSSNDCQIREVFSKIWIPGFIYTFCINLSSNQKFYAISSGATIMTIASIIIICKYVSSNEKVLHDSNNRRSAFLTLLLILLQMASQLYMRYSSVFWEKGTQNQVILSTAGLQKGILMSQAAFQVYEKLERDIAVIRYNKDINNLLCLSKNTWLYLSAEKNMSTYSAWLSGINDSSIAKLEHYFRFFPQKRPDTIFIEKKYKNFIPLYKNKGYVVKQQVKESYILRKESER